jgi:translation elongation factor EF-4
VKIKACIGTSQKAICQGIIKPYKRDFTGLFKGNMSGSSLERLNKKLSHQREGKARMRAVGNLLIPKEAFINVIRQSANQEK